MNSEKFIKLAVSNLSKYYNYRIIEVESIDGSQNFWGLSREEADVIRFIIFVDEYSIDNMNIGSLQTGYSKPSELIKIVLTEDKYFSVGNLNINLYEKIIVIDTSVNKILYYTEGIQDIVNQLYRVVDYCNNINNKSKKSQIYPMTYGLIGINVILYLITALLSGNLLDSDINVLVFLGAKVNTLIHQGQYYRLLTCAFLHGGLMHLGLNMYALYALGPLVERIFGKIKYIAIYIFSAIVSSIFSYAFSASVSIGASGAIFGLLGTVLVFGIKMRNKVGRDFVRNIVSVIFINIFIGITIPNIDNFGHLGGLVGGALSSMILINKD